MALLAATGKQGVVLLSGDVHFAELNRQDCPALGYPLWDITSSGLTHSWGGPIKPLGIHLCTMGITRVGGFYPEKNWGEVEVEWVERGASGGGRGDVETPVAGGAAVPVGGDGGGGGALDLDATTVTLRVLGVDDGVVHLTQRLPLASLYRAPGVPQDAAALALAHACLADGLTSGFTPSCRAFMEGCGPALLPHHNARYFAGHAVVIGGMAVGVLGVALSPCLVWWVGPRLPGGRPLALAVVVAGIAAAWAFLQSMG